MRERKPLPALTGLRFFAALAIFNVHFFRPAEWGWTLPDYIGNILRSGITGVSLFFLLSGFILAYAHSDMQPSDGLARRSFWASRFARIYPVYLLGLIWFAPFILTHRFTVEPVRLALEKSAASFFPSLFLIQAWGPPRFALSWNGPGWTLSVEAVFYLLFPFALPVIRQLPDRMKLLLVIGAIAASSALSFTDYLVPRHMAILAGFVGLHPLFHIPTFIAGMAFGSHFASSRASNRLGTLLCCAGMLAIAGLCSISSLLDPLFLKNSAFLLPFAVLIYGLALDGRPLRWLGSRVMVHLGEASYSLYILQFSIGMTLGIFIDRAGFHDFILRGMLAPRLTGPNLYLTQLVVSVLVSLLVFRWVETPCRRGIKRWFDAQEARRAPAVPIVSEAATGTAETVSA
jgi:peptidoglycan/LPS O-acetylase OafA/YrhL